jgi:hypothetical protein
MNSWPPRSTNFCVPLLCHLLFFVCTSKRALRRKVVYRVCSRRLKNQSHLPTTYKTPKTPLCFLFKRNKIKNLSILQVFRSLYKPMTHNCHAHNKIEPPPFFLNFSQPKMSFIIKKKSKVSWTFGGIMYLLY